MSGGARLALAVLAALLLLPPAAAQAQDRGSAQLVVGGAAAERLAGAGAKVAGGKRRLNLPVERSRTGSPATLRLGGAIGLKRGNRKLALRSLRVSLRAGSARVTALLGKRRRTVLTGDARAKRLTIDRATGRIALAATPIALTRATAKRVAARLGMRRAPRGRLAHLVVAVPASPGPVTPGGPGPSGPGGGPGSGGETLPRIARPAAAVDITGASITWHVRDSFIRYINGGEGTSVSGGATSEPPRAGCESSEPLVYDFHFPFSSGWYDPASGRAAIYYGGAVRFRWDDHGIDITAAEPEIELDGGASRSIFRFQDSGGDRRGVMADLGPLATPVAKQCDADPGPAGGANPQVAGSAYTYERVAGSVPEGTGDSVFAGFYLAGEPFGWFTVTFTTP